MAYTSDSIWRNRDQFFQGRDAIEAFLTDKWSMENGYRLRKELFAFKDNKVSFDSLGDIPTASKREERGRPQRLFRIGCLILLRTDCSTVLV